MSPTRARSSPGAGFTSLVTSTRWGAPFAFALIKLDGADTALLHAVEASSEAAMKTGMRVRADWADERVGRIQDVRCFVPEEAA